MREEEKARERGKGLLERKFWNPGQGRRWRGGMVQEIQGRLVGNRSSACRQEYGRSKKSASWTRSALVESEGEWAGNLHSKSWNVFKVVGRQSAVEEGTKAHGNVTHQ